MTQRTTTVRQLEAEFADAMTRMYAVGNGLARLRAELDLEAPQRTRPSATATPSTGAGAPGPVPVPPAPPAPPAPPLPPPPPRSAAPREAWYRREGAVTRVLALAGAVITMAGVAMLLVLAVQQGWFGPQARVAAGALLAAVLVGLGVRGGEADRRTHPVTSAPVALVATGAAAAYLDVVAMTTGYGWVAPALGLVLSGLVALGGLHLARRWDSELLAVLMVAGAAALAPIVAQDFGWVVSAYLAILCLTAWWAGGSRTRPALTLVRMLPVTLSLLAGAVAAAPDSADAVGHLVVAVVVLLGTLATSAASVRRDAHDVVSSVALALASSALLACAAALSEPYRSLSLAVTAAVLFLAATAVTRAPVGPVAPHLVVTAGAAGTVAAVLAVVSGAPDRFVTTGLLLLALGLLAVAGATRSRTTLGLGAGASAVALLAWAQHPLAIVTAGSAVRHDMVAALLDSVLVGALVAIGLWAVAAQRGLGRDVRVGTTVLAWVLGLSASATAVVAVGTLVGTRLGEPVTGFTVGHALATVTWMLAAAWLLLRGLDRSRDADLTLRTGLLLTGVCVAKLFLYDLAALSGLVRSVAFIATGLLLLATGSRYATAWERRRIEA
ncbi:MAG TPA: DUF2339 domain-containing protein [Ornithinibacter sp.]|nr:DUF2339 domain-containing protein [Ornithinibacter sp.]